MAADTIHFSAERMAEWDRHYEEKPLFRQMRDIIVQYAEAQGGLTLEFWKLKRGHWFGDPVVWSVESIAAHLCVSASDLRKISDETGAWLVTQLKDDPEYQALMKRRKR